MGKQIMYITDVAAALGRTEKAIRHYIYRQDWRAVPQPFRLAGRLCWLPSQVESFLLRVAAAQGVVTDAGDTTHQVEPTSPTRRRPGRPRKS